MPKDTFLQIRIREEIKEDLRLVAEARGLTISALIHSLIVKTIREEREQYPGSFVSAESTKTKNTPARVARLEVSGKIADKSTHRSSKKRPA